MRLVCYVASPPLSDRRDEQAASLARLPIYDLSDQLFPV